MVLHTCIARPPLSLTSSGNYYDFLGCLLIHYQLRCDGGHEFDGWFRDSAAYGEQAHSGLLECPRCGERRVDLALMAPAVPRKRRLRAASPAAVTPPAVDVAAVAAPAADAAPPPAATGQLGQEPAAPARDVMLPDQLRAALQRLRSDVERQCEYVGDRFASEARRIHDGDAERRGIYGEATPAEAERLAEDGIDVSRIPWLPRADA
jgi:hypothetical protein